MKEQLQRFLQLIKIRIVIVNLITALGGVILASPGSYDLLTTICIIIGTMTMVGSACALNNVLDIDIDSKMQRTKNRILVKGEMSQKTAKQISLILLFVSSIVLYLGTNVLTLLVSLFGWFVYIVLYTLWLKRRNFLGIFVGGLSGAVPPLIGYCGISNTVDMKAILIFSILFVWQLPHSWAIVIRRLDDFKRAEMNPLFSMDRLLATKVSMIVTALLLIPVTYSLTYFNMAGNLYGIAAILTGFIFLYLCIVGLFTKNDTKWAGHVFIYSVNHLTLLILCLTLDLKI